jgi:hypothetical protein
MHNAYTFRERKTLELTFRCLSSICIAHTTYSVYFTHHEFTFFRDRLLGRRLFSKVLQRWNIQNSQELKQQIHWFINKGVREEFNQYLHQMSALSASGRKHYMETLTKSHPDYAKLLITYKNIHTLPPAGIIAFDLAWAIYLCRVGRTLHYLTKQEAWEWMFRAAQIAQKSYSSWEEYFSSFFTGSQFHPSTSNLDNIATYTAALCYYPRSPIMKLEWNSKLFNDENKSYLMVP